MGAVHGRQGILPWIMRMLDRSYLDFILVLYAVFELVLFGRLLYLGFEGPLPLLHLLHLRSELLVQTTIRLLTSLHTHGWMRGCHSAQGMWCGVRVTDDTMI